MPISARKRNAILADIRAGNRRNEIARKHGVSAGSVTSIAKQAGLSFDRSATEKATRARAADCRALRTQLQADLLADAQRFRARAWSPYQVAMSTAEGIETITLSLPPLQDARAAYTAIGIAVDKDLAIERAHADDGSGLAAVDAWLRGMLGEPG